MRQVTMHYAKTHLSELVARAEAGEEIIIARRDRPAVKLARVSAAPAGPRQPGRLRGLASIGPAFFEPLPDEERALWEGGGD